MSSIFSDIANSVPINNTTRLVAGGVGEGFNFRDLKIVQTADSEEVIEYMTKVPLYIRNGRHELRKSLEVAIGRKFGRLTVMGMAKHLNKAKAKWVVRCDCSMYSLRTFKAIMNENNNKDCCERCRLNAYIRNKASFLSSGKDLKDNGYISKVYSELKSEEV